MISSRPTPRKPQLPHESSLSRGFGPLRQSADEVPVGTVGHHDPQYLRDLAAVGEPLCFFCAMAELHARQQAEGRVA